MPDFSNRRAVTTLFALALITFSFFIPVANAQTTEPFKPTPAVQTLLDNAQKARASGDYDSALRRYADVVKSAQAANDLAGEANAQIGIGNTQFLAKRYTDALNAYENALALKKKMGDTTGAARTVANIGNVHLGMGNGYLAANDPQKAADSYELALIRFRAAQSKPGIVAVLNNLGAVYEKLGQPAKGVAAYTQLVAFCHENNDSAGEAKALADRGESYVQMSRVKDASESLQQSLALYRTIKDEKGEATVLSGLGLIYKQIGDIKNAQASYQSAHDLYLKLNDPSTAATLLVNLANTYQQQNNTTKALELYNQALPDLRAAKNYKGEAAALNGLGGVYINIGDPTRALGFYDQSLAISRREKDRKAEADALANGGTANRIMDNGVAALGLFGQALPIYREVKDIRGEAITLASIGNTYYDAALVKEAIPNYEQALPLFRQLEDKRSIAITLGNLGGTYALSGDKKKGLALLSEAVPILHEIEDRYNEAATLTNLGSLHRANGEPDKALDDFNAAIALCKEIGNSHGAANALVGIAEVREGQKRYTDEIAPLQEAIADFESIRSGLGGLSEAKVLFLASTLGPYQRYVRLQLRQNNDAEAFNTVQKTKGRALLDLMASGRVDIGGALSDDERKQEKSLRQAAETLNQNLLREATLRQDGARERILALRTELAKAESDISTFYNGIYAKHPDLSEKRVAKTAVLEDLGTIIPENGALIEYVILQAGDDTAKINEVIAFVVTASGGKASVKSVKLPIVFTDLDNDTTELRRACADPSKPYQSLAHKLYNQLIAPLGGLIKGKEHIVVCPDGALWDVPFAALLDTDNGFLLASHEITYAYSATSAQAALRARKETGRIPATGTLFAVGNPDFGDANRFGKGGKEVSDSSATVGMMGRSIDMMSRGLGNLRSIDMMSRGGIDMMSRSIDMMSRGGIDMMSRGGIDMMSRGGIDMMSRSIDMMSRDGKINPLPGTQREVEAIAKDFTSPTVYFTKEALKKTVQREAGNYRFVHLASHAFFNDAAPLTSGIILADPGKDGSDDGILTARNLFDMNLSADMVCLSACNTARGAKQSGEGIVGLTWALFVAGAPTTVVSQWAVNDESTALLMEQFYSGIGQGLDKGTALRRAALALSSDKQRAHPYFWAPFILIGDWNK